jgi:hypothetical protein
MSTEVTTQSGSSSKSSWMIELAKIGVPSLMSLITIIFGYYIYGLQTDIQAKVDSSQEILRNQLALQAALGEEFYKRRLSVYENACKELAAAEAALNNAGSGITEAKTSAIDVFIKLEQLNKGNAFYWSPSLREGLTQFWAMGTHTLRYDQYDEEQSDQISKEIATLHEQMKKDLNVADLSEIMNQKK